MLVHSLLLSIILSCCCSADGDHHDNPPATIKLGSALSPAQSDDEPTNTSPAPEPLVQDQESETMWRSRVLDLLTQLVKTQKEAARHQTQVVHLLSMLGNQSSQQVQDLQNVARHQSLLVENHQALLLQISRIATYLLDMTKKPATASQ